MADVGKIEVTWKSSKRGRVCTATAVSKNGKVLARCHITLPHELTTEFYRAYGSLCDVEIEKAARAEVNFMLDNPALFQ